MNNSAQASARFAASPALESRRLRSWTSQATLQVVAWIDDRGGGIVNFVEFDLSVAVQSHVEGSAGAKAKLEVIGLDLGGAELKGGLDHTRVQRINFQVPVSFPAQS